MAKGGAKNAVFCLPQATTQEVSHQVVGDFSLACQDELGFSAREDLALMAVAGGGHGWYFFKVGPLDPGPLTALAP